MRPSPDLAYSACVYDLSAGPIRVTAAAWDDYMSVSAFAANSDNFFVSNDREAPNGVDFTLIRAGDEKPADAVVVSSHCNGEIGLGRLQVATRVIMEQHLAALRHAGQRQHLLDGAPRHGAHGHHHAFGIEAGHKGDFIACGGEAGAKEAGKMRAEGKEYVVQDGDVLLFRFNV